MKTHIQILAWLYIAICAPLLAAGLIICIGLAWHADAEAIKALQFVGPPIGFAAVVYLIPGLICGIGLLRLRRWARILAMGLAALQIPLLPVGTALAVYGFWIVLNSETRDLFARSPISASGPFSPRPPSALLDLFGVMAMVASGFFLVLRAGFTLHHDPMPPPPIDSFALTITAALVLVAGSVAVALRILRAPEKPGDASRRQAEANFARNDVLRLLRVAELAADPARAKYAPLVERGEVWSDTNIAYAEDPTLTTTCAHLQPIERAMRDAGIPARRFREQDATVKCRIDFEALKRDFEVATPVRYSEFYAGRPADNDNPTAFIICDEHKSIIHTLHPEESGAKKTPLFPASG